MRPTTKKTFFMSKEGAGNAISCTVQIHHDAVLSEGIDRSEKILRCKRFSRCRIEAVVIMELGRIDHRVVLSQ